MLGSFRHFLYKGGTFGLPGVSPFSESAELIELLEPLALGRLPLPRAKLFKITIDHGLHVY